MDAKFNSDSRRWLSLDYRPLELEKEIRAFWKLNQTRKQMEQLRLKRNHGILGYVEGPPTLNGVPHIGHARGRIMKDLRYRWKTMQGYYMPFWAGWDCQGLPVELEVERELGVKNKRELVEKVGEERFIEECKKVVMKYHREWFNADETLGVFINHENAYWTYLDSYIEREWQILKRSWEQGLLGEGYYVVAYCPHCQTSLSQAEVGLGYEEVTDPSLYFKMKIKAEDKPDEYFLVWTTMPFTLVTDMMLAVHGEGDYVKVRVGAETWVLAKSRLEPVMQELGIEEYKVLETVRGADLEGAKYEYPFLDMIPKQAELDRQNMVHTVVCEDFVDLNTATGVVHLSPGNGEDDFAASQKRGIQPYVPFDDECNFTSEAGAFAGMFARDADKVVVEELKRRNLLVQVKNIRHEYPTCWRSHHKLIWLARREYFLWTNKINQRVVEAAEKVEYYYESPKNRFLSFLREGKPWCISRQRIWGAPLPIWRCEDCGNTEFISSRKELLEKAVEKPGVDFELHKPWIDRLLLVCGKCGGRMRREPFVLDTWHNSGASPYARFTEEEYSRYVPVAFLVEAIDQTRGWANTLLLEHVILSGKPESPYKAYLFYGFVLDAKGRKMSKSLGNYMEVNPLLEQVSADLCRFYLLWKCSPIDSMNFDINELKKRPYQVLSTLYHLHRFFAQNAEYDGFNPRKHSLEWASETQALKLPDRWLLSKLQARIGCYTEMLERCEFNFALAELERFIVEDVSRVYVPMIRRELWSDDPEALNRRLAIYAVLWRVLKTVTLLLNPATPHLCEFLYQHVYRHFNPESCESVNFESWPTPDPRLQDSMLEKSFDMLLQTVSLSYAARQAAKVKRRWPLQKAIVVAPQQAIRDLESLKDVFLELANVNSVEFTEQATTVDADRWASASDGGLQVQLDTFRDEELLGRGVMRDLARRVQSLRKELGFVPTDVVGSVHVAELDEENMRLLAPYLEELAGLVRARKVCFHANRSEARAEWHEYELDGKRVYVAIDLRNSDGAGGA